MVFFVLFYFALFLFFCTDQCGNISYRRWQKACSFSAGYAWQLALCLPLTLCHCHVHLNNYNTQYYYYWKWSLWKKWKQIKADILSLCLSHIHQLEEFGLISFSLGLSSMFLSHISGYSRFTSVIFFSFSTLKGVIHYLQTSVVFWWEIRNYLYFSHCVIYFLSASFVALLCFHHFTVMS